MCDLVWLGPTSSWYNSGHFQRGFPQSKTMSNIIYFFECCKLFYYFKRLSVLHLMSEQSETGVHLDSISNSARPFPLTATLFWRFTLIFMIFMNFRSPRFPQWANMIGGHNPGLDWEDAYQNTISRFYEISNQKTKISRFRRFVSVRALANLF